VTRLVGAIARNAWPLAIGAATFTVAVGLPANDPDMWWHLASGRWMVEHRDALRVDVFSSTQTGSPYALGETLGEILLYLPFAASSWLGLAVARAVLVAVAAFSVARSALRSAPARIAVPLAVVAVVLSKPIWTDRPQLFTLAFFPLVLDLLLSARGGSRAALIAAIALVVVWSPLHGGYALGVLLLWTFTVAALLERRPATAFLVAAAVATFLVTLAPGALSLGRALEHVGSATRGIVEESPVDVLTPFGALFALALAGSLAVFLIAGADLLTALVLVPVLALALSAQRHIPLFGFAAVPFVASALTTLRPGLTELARARRRSGASVSRGAMREASSERSGIRRRDATDLERERSAGSAAARDRSGAAASLAVALWVGAVASIATIDPRPDLHAYPNGALAALKSGSGVLLNEYDWGGYLIWNVPERPVFIDGRLFPFLADDVLGGYRRAVHVLPGWRAAIDHWNVTQALLRPDRALGQALRDEGWTVRAADAGFVLLERPR
jgi:hypothetical protein